MANVLPEKENKKEFMLLDVETHIILYQLGY